MSVLFLQYPKCGTCRKAAKWLKDNDIEVQSRDITLNNPSQSEIAAWVKASGIGVAKFFNTSGLKYRELKIKEQVKSSDDEHLFGVLASDGMLVKRPIVVSGNNVLVGFNEQQWSKVLLGK